MPSLSLVGISLTLNVDYLFMAAPTKCSHAPLRGHGVSPLGHCPWPWTWDSSSRPPLLTLDVVYLQRSRSCSSLLEHPRCFTTLLLFIKYNSTISELYVISTFWFIYILRASVCEFIYMLHMFVYIRVGFHVLSSVCRFLSLFLCVLLWYYLKLLKEIVAINVSPSSL